MKKGILYGTIAIVILISLSFIYFLGGKDSTETTEILSSVQFGDFVIDITTTGELEAKNSVNIPGPSGLQRAHIWQVKIDDIVDEGTVVEKGEYIARLDQTELLDKVQQARNDLQQSDSKYIQTRLDTAMELRKARNELINLEYEIQEKRIVYEQSKFEPPATQQQAKIASEKAQRAYDQAVDAYSLKSEKAAAQMLEVGAIKSDDQIRLNFLTKLQEQFTIEAPESGMVIYKRSWNVPVGGLLLLR